MHRPADIDDITHGRDIECVPGLHDDVVPIAGIPYRTRKIEPDASNMVLSASKYGATRKSHPGESPGSCDQVRHPVRLGAQRIVTREHHFPQQYDTPIELPLRLL